MLDRETFNFSVSSGLLAPGHFAAMGLAVWVYLWLVDKTTSEAVSDGVTCGLVLYGRPIRSHDIADALGVPLRTCRDYLCRLEKSGYITIARGAAGMTIQVRKSTKWRRRNEHGQQHPGGSSRSQRAARKDPRQGYVDWEEEARRGL